MYCVITKNTAHKKHRIGHIFAHFGIFLSTAGGLVFNIIFNVSKTLIAYTYYSRRIQKQRMRVIVFYAMSSLECKIHSKPINQCQGGRRNSANTNTSRTHAKQDVKGVRNQQVLSHQSHLRF